MGWREEHAACPSWAQMISKTRVPRKGQEVPVLQMRLSL